ncbi:Bacterial surface antigen (D15) [Arabidopsis thaliana x Arabidopsis arenosa]|uniref:Bacterial surface antigen (D15) n=1 Tax=Arabidopsis thaliana x Arabidopsis arenosa TaxID=1240361 RepID=A0A8T1XLW0_9BRAS|nr:Bacterial surface antigen (D15) [Arabidopsis thaliana x Arabidopsis arenosa]
MPTIALNGQLIAAPIVYTTASSYLSSRRQYYPLSSSRELRFNASSSSRFKSLTCSANLPTRKKIEPSSNNVLLNSFSKSLVVCSSGKPKDSTNGNLRKPLGISLVVTSVSSTASLFLPRLFSLLWIVRGGGGRGGGGGGGGNFGGGGDGGFWRKLFSLGVPVAVADEEQSPDWDSHGLPANIVVQFNKLSGFKKYKISDIIFFDRRRKATVETEDSFFEMVSIQEGGVYTKAQLQKELETLTTCGWFEKVDFEGKTKPDGTLGVTISFAESMWQGAERFRCINVGLMTQPKPVKIDSDMTEKEMIEYLRSQEKEYKQRIKKARPCLLPGSIQREAMLMLRDQRSLSARLLHTVKERVLKWYQDQGYSYANVVNFGNLNSKELVFEVMEGDITQLVIQFQDKLGNVVEGNTQIPVVRRQIPKQLRPGHVLNMKVANEAVRNIHSLGLFSNIEIMPVPDEKKEGGVIVEVKLQEADQKSVDVSADWSIVPGPRGFPSLASFQPSGTVSFEHRNIKGLNRSLIGSVATSNFLNPEDDLSFKLEFVHPYLDGVNNPRNRTFKTSIFNSSKLSPVFTGGPGFEEAVAPILVDRAGVKATITEDFTRQSKLTYGVVLEEITTRDENGKISSNGQVLLPNGGINVNGPPTTLSGTGIDRVAFLQGNITQDNTKFVNGAIVGDRKIFQVDQGLGIGSNSPLFNRHQLTLTKFIPLRQVEEGPGKPQPPVLVLHGHYAGCVGDLPGYDAFALGGPNSVRGYTKGELGAARNIVEVGAEVRVPINNTQVYAFAEHGNDLGSSKDVKGNPTAAFRRKGHGSSYGVGVKLGQIRAEYAVDHNCGTGALSLQFGERY